MAKNGILTAYDDDGVPIASGHTPQTSQTSYTDLAVSTGGLKTATVVTGTVGSGLVKAGPGRLCKVVVTTAGTSSDNITLYDNDTAASGTVIAVIPGGTTLGTVYDLQVPVTKGIWAANVASGPAITLSYI